MALHDKAAGGIIPSHEAEERVLAALAESETLPELFECRDRRRNGDGTCHRFYSIRCFEEAGSRSFEDGGETRFMPTISA